MILVCTSFISSMQTSNRKRARASEIMETIESLPRWFAPLISFALLRAGTPRRVGFRTSLAPMETQVASVRPASLERLLRTRHYPDRRSAIAKQWKAVKRGEDEPLRAGPFDQRPRAGEPLRTYTARVPGPRSPASFRRMERDRWSWVPRVVAEPVTYALMK
jgi:hypothetical protein